MAAKKKQTFEERLAQVEVLIGEMEGGALPLEDALKRYEEGMQALTALDSGVYGMVLRAKGIVACADGGWIHFDFVPEEANVRMGSADVIGKLCVIGAQLDEHGVAKLFGV